MLRARIAVFVLAPAFLGIASFAHAADTDPGITLSYIRAVRVSSTSLTLSFKTNEESIGQVTYAQQDSSSIQLTDSSPQTDHLFTMTELSPAHGYSFTLAASTDAHHSNSYVVLLAPESVGVTGQSIVPAVQVLTPSGDVVSSIPSASSTSPSPKPFAPWWAFAILFVLVVGGWIGNTVYRRLHSPSPF